MRAGKGCELILKFTNPTQHQTTIALLDINHGESQSNDGENVTSKQTDSVEHKLSSVEEVRIQVH